MRLTLSPTRHTTRAYPAMNHHDQDHDREPEGLIADFARIERLRVGRRRALAMLGATGGCAVLFGCGGSDGSAASAAPVTTVTSSTATAAATATATAISGACTAPSSETNGPYPADGTNASSGATSNALTASGVVRSDIRSSFVGASNTTAVGVAMTFTITVVDVNNGCAPLAGYAIYLWHCDKDGDYSLYNLPAESYLRGVQITDADGRVTFTTVVPGCYNGRYPHLHFEVFSSLTIAINGNYARLISQFAIPSAVCAAVYATSDYATSLRNYNNGNNTTSNDNIFGDATSAQLAVMTPTMSGTVSAGYVAATTIGIAT